MRNAYMDHPEGVEAHRVLDPIGEGGRVIIVGDVHGCLDELQELLKECNFQKEKDKVIVVGDLVNKGPKSIEVVKYVMSEGLLSIKGNHDDWVLPGFYGQRPNDPEAWYNDLTPEEAKFLLELPFTISIPQFNVIVVHAGLVPGIPLKDQHHGTMYRLRNLVKKVDQEGTVTYEAHERIAEGEPWASFWPGPEHVIFGHDAMRKLQTYEHATGLDTGCVYGFALTACILSESGRELRSVQAKRVYEVPTGSV
eukprot:TRINITY_DN7449_c0_g1_i1.p1 TRINITY_DN7449_c0_g1~~TRINITY_DN7449_c0_g1_i1.p1  ORF type:complete len:252 (+),score=49.91 TRINITY_DN7449_c0_g1_i1:56-811(+)